MGSIHALGNLSHHLVTESIILDSLSERVESCEPDVVTLDVGVGRDGLRVQPVDVGDDFFGLVVWHVDHAGAIVQPVPVEHIAEEGGVLAQNGLVDGDLGRGVADDVVILDTDPELDDTARVAGSWSEISIST